MMKVAGWWMQDIDNHTAQWARTGRCPMFTDYYASLKKALEHVNDYEVAIDAGGHVGTWAMEIAKSFDRVISFEPLEANYECHELNTKDNDKIELVKKALGAEAGTTGYTIGTSAGAGFTSGEGSIEVVTIDSLELPSCGFIKADIEGHEYNAFKGAEETINKYKPVILFEDKGCEQRNLGQERGNAGRYLESLGYEQKLYLNRDSLYVWS